jgi:Restriction endonuclease/Protein of unknown function (DUF2510)
MGDIPSSGWRPDPTGRHEYRYFDGNLWSHNVANRGIPAIDPMEPATGDARRFGGQAEPAATEATAEDHARDQPPEPRLIRTPRDAEEAAARYMRYLGFADADVTSEGADGGIDVRSEQAVAQVKAHMTPVGRPDLQKLYGVQTVEKRQGLFFSLMHYTPNALAWAETVGMPLFRFDMAGQPEPVNAAAKVLVADAVGLPAEPPERIPADDTAPAKTPWWAYPFVCDSTSAVRIISREAGHSLFGSKESVTAIKRAWIPAFRYQLDFTTSHGRQGKLAQESTSRTFDALFGNLYWVQISAVSPTAPDDTVKAHLLRRRVDPEDPITNAYREWDHYCKLVQAAALQRQEQRVRMYGLPINATTISLTFTHAVLMPLYVGLLERGGLRRAACVDGLSSMRMTGFEASLTQQLTSFADELHRLPDT